MVTLEVSLDELLRARKNGRKKHKLELELEVPLEEPVEIRNTKEVNVQHVASRYRVSLKGLLYDQIEDMCKHVRSLGYETLMIQLGDFPFRGEFDRNRVNIDFLGIVPIADTYEFGNFIYDTEKTMEVETRAITYYNEQLGPGDDAIGLFDLFDKGVIGYSISASISDRLDGSACGIVVLNSKDRKIAEKVHDEVLKALRTFYFTDTAVENASTKALKHVCDTSEYKDILKFHQW